MANDPFPKSVAERLLEVETSTSRLARLLEENDPARFAKRILENDATRIADAIEKTKGSELALALRQAAQVQEAFKRIVGTPQFKEFVKGTNAFLEFMREPATVTAIREANQRVAQAVLSVQPVIRPVAESLGALMLEVARSIKPYEGAFDKWQASLADRIALLHQPWALEAEVRLSATGFARLARLSDAVHSPKPFEDRISDLLHEELGEVPAEDEDATPMERDTAALEAGMQAELIAFPAGEYTQITLAAGFHFRIPAGPVPNAVEFEEPGAVYNPLHNAVVTQLEQALRRLVETELSKLAAGAWVKRRVPKQVADRWKERQEEDRSAGRPVYSEIQYADFMDIADVVCRNDNWEDSFRVFFTNRDEFRVSMCRLHPVRKALGHSRPLGKSDVLTLVGESTRLFRALGIKVLE